MNRSLYVNLTEKYFSGLVLIRLAAMIGADDQPSDYAHTRMLSKEYSVDGTWENIISNNRNISANYVAMGSPLPLKNRGTMGSAGGKIPKLGMKMFLNEVQARAIDIMIAEKGEESAIGKKLFEDIDSCLRGVLNLNEFAFWRGFSTGELLVEDSRDGGVNVGQGIYVDYGYLADQKSGVPIIWGGAGYKPVTDIRNMLSKAEAKGKYPTIAWMTEGDLSLLRNSDEAKDLYAKYVGNFGADKSLPTRNQFLEAFADEFNGLKITVVKKTSEFEINGKPSSESAFKAGFIVLNNTEKVGSLVWSKVPEMNRRVDGVNYQVADEHILLKKYSKTDPLQEWTASESFSLPVITEVENIFLLNTKEVQV